MLQQIMMMVEMMKAKAALQQQVGTVKSIIVNDEGAGRTDITVYGQDIYMTVYDAGRHSVSDAKEIADNASIVYDYYDGRTVMHGVDDTHLMHLTWNGGGIEFEYIYG